MANTLSPQDFALEFASKYCFHQSFKLPETADHGPLRVTYATTSNFETSKDAETVLWIGPMVSSRYFCLDLNHIAEKSGIRFIFVDRPGFGGTTPVPIDQRISVWLEIVPALLAKLQVKHVALVSHSAGTIPLLNTLARLRDILHPTKPYVALLAPWAHPEHSNAALMSVASQLPPSVVSQWGGLMKFINRNVMPATSYSSGLLGSVSSFFREGPSEGASVEAEEVEFAHGMTVAMQNALDKLQSKYVFAEDSSGINEEALLCLEKGGNWGACDDYRAYVAELVVREKERTAEAASHPEFAQGASERLRVKAFFSATDVMIGEGGQKYFEDCWQKESVKDAIDFQSIAVPDTNHDSIISPRKAAWVQILADLGGALDRP